MALSRRVSAQDVDIRIVPSKGNRHARLGYGWDDFAILDLKNMKLVNVPRLGSSKARDFDLIEEFSKTRGRKIKIRCSIQGVASISADPDIDTQLSAGRGAAEE